MNTRLQRLRDRLAASEAPAALILDPYNVNYLTGFTGTTAALLVSADRAVFITDSRYIQQAELECPGFERAMTRGSGSYAEAIAASAKGLGTTSLAFEGDFVTMEQYERLKEEINGIALRSLPGLASELRRVKDSDEIAILQRACDLADRAFDFVITLVRPGARERDVALDLEYFMKKHGAKKEAFDTIVASGPRSALPHGRASERAFQAGDFITFDFGARLDGYGSDLTRTVVLGKANTRQLEVYSAVLDAQTAAIHAIRGGASGQQVDGIARDVICSRGFGAYFGHGLGHGLGRKVHDHLGMSQSADVKLLAGMVLTVEPGIYIPDWGGVRIEDDVVVTESGCDLLTHAPRDLIEVPC